MYDYGFGSGIATAVSHRTKSARYLQTPTSIMFSIIVYHMTYNYTMTLQSVSANKIINCANMECMIL